MGGGIFLLFLVCYAHTFHVHTHTVHKCTKFCYHSPFSIAAVLTIKALIVMQMLWPHTNLYGHLKTTVPIMMILVLDAGPGYSACVYSIAYVCTVYRGGTACVCSRYSVYSVY